MKTFYTVRDIEDMHAAGVTEVEVDDDVVLTDLAREKAIALGIRLKTVQKRTGRPPRGLPRMAVAPKMQLPPATTPAPPPPPPPAPASTAQLVERIKSEVVARLGTGQYNDLLDQIIPQVLERLNREG
ncbi:MAG: hypothetical protein ACE5G8_10300 [Anaerolineae bacterium]